MDTLPNSFWRSTAFGYVCGATMAVGASIAFAFARVGVLQGLSTHDLIFLRFLVAGLCLLLFLLRWGASDLAGIGWRRGLILLVLGGPLFGMLQTGGYAFAPLAHGAVIAPSTVTILSTIAAGLFLGERLTRNHMVGAALVLLGITLISWQGLVASKPGETAWLGDLLFIFSSIMWAAFTVLLKYWKLNALKATAVVAVLSMLITTPAYLVYYGFDHLLALPLQAVLVQGFVQGFIQGAIAITAYSRAVVLLGVSKAVLFPATIPAIAVLIGIPLVGELPTLVQLSGLAVVSVGLLSAVGAFAWRRRTKMPAIG